MADLIIGVGDCHVTADRGSVLVTYALGSCIAVMIHDPLAHVGGMLHFMLPESSIDRDKAAQRPFVFADTGIPRLFKDAYHLGAEKRRLIVTAAGGAQMADTQGVFNVGKRNCLAVRKILWKAGVLLQAEELGGLQSRTVRLDMASGTVTLGAAGTKEILFAGAPRKEY